MAASQDTLSMALFCDFENVALGVRDAKYDKFDIKPVLERLLLKGSIVVKKAYCDWDRYKGFKATMHEANFELIEIPHVRQSGKNSADIRLVVDALDLCYTKAHVNTFVIISGDSDFSPLVSKLRENAKQVIGIGVKQSTSDLLIANCDEFIFYDDLVRESQRSAAKREPRETPPAARRTPEEDKRRKEEQEARKRTAIEVVAATFDALLSERGETGKIWASVLKDAIKRRKPDFNEANYGFRAFGNLLDEAQARGLLAVGRDEKSGTYVYRTAVAASEAGADVSAQPEVGAASPQPEAASPSHDSRRKGRGKRKTPEPKAESPVAPEPVVTAAEPAPETQPVPESPPIPEAAPRKRGRSRPKKEAAAPDSPAPADTAPPSSTPAPRDTRRRGRQKPHAPVAEGDMPQPQPVQQDAPASSEGPAPTEAGAAKAKRKPSARRRSPKAES